MAPLGTLIECHPHLFNGIHFVSVETPTDIIMMRTDGRIEVYAEEMP
jgi:hypothetical protein